MCYCLIFSFCYRGFSSNKVLLWFLVVTSLTGYSLLRIGWGCYNKFALLRCVRSAFGSVTFEACFMCVIIIAGMV